MTNPKAKWNRDDNMDKLLLLLKEKKELTFKKLKEGLGVSDPTLTEYVKLLEQQKKIEHFDKPTDRRSQWYRIKEGKENEVKSQVGKYEAINFLRSIQNPVYHYRPGKKIELAAFSAVPASVNRKEYQKMVESVVDNIPVWLLRGLPKLEQKMAVVIMVNGKGPANS